MAFRSIAAFNIILAIRDTITIISKKGYNYPNPGVPDWRSDDTFFLFAVTYHPTWKPPLIFAFDIKTQRNTI